MQRELEKFQTLINKANNILFFGGAGVSTESGIPDFRSADGLYSKSEHYSPEQILSHDFFFQHTALFYDFYREKMLHLQAKPNITHQKIAKLEQQGKVKGIVTQNIDGLHQAAGSSKVHELHGSVHQNTCLNCQAAYDVTHIIQSQGIPLCACGGIIKPDVVLYGEALAPHTVEQAIAAITESDLLVIGGTSLNVYPAAGLIDYYQGSEIILINKEPTPQDKRASLLLTMKLGDVFGSLLLR